MKEVGVWQPALNQPCQRLVALSCSTLPPQLSEEALNFLCRTGSDAPLAGVYLAGGGARTPGLLEGLSRQLEIPVEMVDPFARVQIGRNLDPDVLQEMAPALAVAVGLGARRPGDA